MNGPTAANIAREAARGGNSTYFGALSQQMCWDAVAACQGRPPGRHIDENAQVVANMDALRTIPEGATIGFFDGGTLVHAMISLGGGSAAGTKNACVGLGNPIGWEILDLTQGWHATTFGPRHLLVRQRTL